MAELTSTWVWLWPVGDGQDSLCALYCFRAQNEKNEPLGLSLIIFRLEPLHIPDARASVCLKKCTFLSRYHHPPFTFIIANSLKEPPMIIINLIIGG